MSWTVTVNEPLSLLPAASVAVQETSVSPSGNVDPEAFEQPVRVGEGSRLSFAAKETLAPDGDVASALMSSGRFGSVVSTVQS